MSHIRHRDFAQLERDWGIITLANDWLPEEFKNNYSLACDAQPAMITSTSGGIPAYLTMVTDPKPIRVLQAPNAGAKIIGEQKTGTWTMTTAIFTVVENVGELAVYGDRNTNGRSNVNATFPQRQSFHFQTVVDYGDREIDMAGEARLNWVTETQTSAAKTLDKGMDYIYHYGVANLQNYGLTNDPALRAALTPVTKTESGLGTSWGSTGLYAAPTEIFNDFQILLNDLITATYGIVEAEDDLTFVCSPQKKAALLSVNIYGVSAIKLIKDAFPKLKVVTSPRYASISGSQFCQLFADKFDGNDIGYCSFTEKMRDHPIIRQLSSYQQKKTAGSWGAIWKYPVAVSSMTGI